MRMTREQAKERLRAKLQPDSEPQLDDATVELLLEDAKRADRYDVWPTQDGWEPTWDLNAAASEGWLLKAGKAAELVSFDTDGSRMDASDVHQHCREMAAYYANRVRGHVREDEWVEWWPAGGSNVANL